MWQLPTTERQASTFDTNACGIFSVLNCIESWLLKLNLKSVRDLGFSEDFNISDRFNSALVGGLNGNLPSEVVNSIKANGLIPESMLPFGGVSQSDYYDKKYLTPEMLSQGKKILDILDIDFKWVLFTYGKEQAIKDALKEAPLVGVITNPNGTTHAVMIFSETEYFDSYEPFIKPLDISKVHYAIKVLVKPKLQATTTYKYFSVKEVIGLKPEFVTLLDKMRGECGFPFKITSGLRTQAQNDALQGSVSDSAHLTGYACDLAINDSLKRFKLVSMALNNGITRIGIGKDFVHIDLAQDKVKNVIWTYY